MQTLLGVQKCLSLMTMMPGLISTVLVLCQISENIWYMGSLLLRHALDITNLQTYNRTQNTDDTTDNRMTTNALWNLLKTLLLEICGYLFLLVFVFPSLLDLFLENSTPGKMRVTVSTSLFILPHFWTFYVGEFLGRGNLRCRMFLL